MEQNNKLCDAVRYYRKAMQLVPDIDVKVMKKSRLRESSKQNKETESKWLRAMLSLNCPNFIVFLVIINVQLYLQKPTVTLRN